MGNDQKDNGFLSGGGKILELVLESAASSPICSEGGSLLNYRIVKEGHKHATEVVADSVKYKVQAYGTRAGFVRVSRRKKIWIEIHDLCLGENKGMIDLGGIYVPLETCAESDLE